jgi:hypothetical protein
MAEIKFETFEPLAILSESNKGWKKEFNLMSWNEREPKDDIRDWSEDHKKMGNGVTLSFSELLQLKDVLNKMPELE